jgi:pimeloyl-ACP methyl ester carboxylesterase
MRSSTVSSVLPALTAVSLAACAAACGTSPSASPDASTHDDTSMRQDVWAPADAAVPEPRFVEGPCALDDPGLPPAAQRRCGTLEVAQLRRAARGIPDAQATIPIHVELVEPTRPGATTVFLTGGPGFSLADYRPLGVLPEVVAASPGPVLFLEQRGNLLSASGLTCEGMAEPEACADALRARGIVPEAFNSLESAEDVADALRALERGPAFVWGHSYGTVLAQRVAFAHPELVRGLILEGVSDPTRTFEQQGIDMLAHRLSVLERFASWHAARCMDEPACAAAHPSGLDPTSDIPYLIMRFMATPGLTLELPGGRALDVQTAVDIVETNLAYHDGLLLTLELFDAIVARERDGDGGRALTALLSRLGEGDAERGSMRLGLLFRPDPRGPSISGDATTCMDLRALRGPLCAPFDATLYPATLTDAIEDATIEVPVLYLQGELDTQSPARTAEILRLRFSQRSEAILGVCVGHFVLRDATECARAALEPFFAGEAVPDAAAVAMCAERACDALPVLSGTRPLPGE